MKNIIITTVLAAISASSVMAGTSIGTSASACTPPGVHWTHPATIAIRLARAVDGPNANLNDFNWEAHTTNSNKQCVFVHKVKG